MSSNTGRLYRSLRTENSSWLFHKYNLFYLNLKLNNFSFSHKKFLPRTINSGILHILGRENILTLGIFSDHQGDTCTQQQSPCGRSAQLLQDSISSCHLHSEWKFQVSNHLRNVNQVRAELWVWLSIRRLNSFSKQSALQAPGPQICNKYCQEGYFICFFYRFSLTEIINRFYENLGAFLCCYWEKNQYFQFPGTMQLYRKSKR